MAFDTLPERKTLRPMLQVTSMMTHAFEVMEPW